HLEGLRFDDDPYALWGRRTTEPQRVMAKLLVKAMINAASPAAAISACNLATSIFTRERDEEGRPVRKRGKELEDARRLLRARDETKLSFKRMYLLVLERHERISRHFGRDMGMTLMRHDSAIALDVLHHFASKCVPCLGVHDSFIVPEGFEEELVR